MNTETKNCQNCKTEFQIEPNDLAFYQKMEVPPPTFCPMCRFQRRLMFRNERILYKRKCDLCNEDVITIFSPDKPFKVYCQPCWWSDKWDPGEYFQEYDPNRNFFKQFKELQQKTPYMALINGYATLVNSPYVNHTGEMKNCYFVFNSDFCENTHYSKQVAHLRDAMDCNMIGNSELLYWDINCGKCSKAFFSEDCSECHDVYFSKNLSGCNNCFGCVNLKNQSYHIWNKLYSKEEYQNKIKEFKLDSYKSVQELKEKALAFWNTQPIKFTHEMQNENSTGDYVYNSKNAYNMYQVRCMEDGRYCQWITTEPVKDCYDYTEWGAKAERIIDSITTGDGVDNIKYCFACWSSDTNIEYSTFVISSDNMFGCCNIRSKKYCILNKQYNEDDYKKLREEIIQSMNENPYVDSKERVWKYGDFFPYDLSLFGYNETGATDHFKKTKEEVEEKGWRWKEPKQNQYEITLPYDKIPDSIHDVPDDATKEILECLTCKNAFKIQKPELELLKRFGFPIPRSCPNCRNEERLNRINPPRLLQRKCMCNGSESRIQNLESRTTYTNTVNHFHGENPCPNEFQTSYSPERPEIVYCKECYQAEVV